MSKNESNSINHDNELIQNAIRFAHDLKTPAMVLRSYLKNKASPELVQQGIEQLLSLSDHYLAQLRAQTTKTRHSQFKEVACLESKELPRMLRQSLRAIASLHHPNITTSFYNYLALQQLLHKEGSWLISAEKVLLQSVFDNIIKNAFEACKDPKRSHVSVRLYQEQSDHIVEIQDTGCGMSADRIRSLQNPSISIASNKTNGHGIGLKASIELIKKWKGQIEISSKIQRGTCVRIRLARLDSVAAHQLN
jgi:two-component system sensor histidine kinase FlrB